MKLSCRMLHQSDGLSFQSPLRHLCVLVFHLLLTHSCRGQSTLIGPPHSIEAAVGDDVILPCHLEPVMDVTSETLEWKRPDLNPRYVHVLRSRQNLENVQNPSYRGRTSLFTDELKRGNISLKLSRVQLSDQGTYECDIPLRHKQSSVKLVVASGSASYPVITLAEIDETTRGVMLDCRSEGWYPEPEVLWLDGEGNLLSAGPPETVRGPDDLYTVSSRVTVEKRHSNSFTCRVQQKNTNQTRETHISISNDFFKLQSSSSPVTTGLAVSLAVCIVLLLFVVCKRRQNRIKTKRSCRDQTEKGEKKKHSKTNKTEDQRVTEEREREQLMTPETVEMEVLKGNEQKKSKHFNKQLHDEQRKKEEAERDLKQLMTKNTEIEKQLQEEKTKMNDAEKEVENVKKEMEDESSSASQSSNTELPIVVEVNQKDNYIRLINTSLKDQRLGGWRLEMKVNEKIISHTFKSSFKLKSRGTVTMSGPGCFQQYDLCWMDLTPWNSGDNLKFTLISDTGVRHQLNSY